MVTTSGYARRGAASTGSVLSAVPAPSITRIRKDRAKGWGSITVPDTQGAKQGAITTKKGRAGWARPFDLFGCGERI